MHQNSKSGRAAEQSIYAMNCPAEKDGSGLDGGVASHEDELYDYPKTGAGAAFAAIEGILRW